MTFLEICRNKAFWLMDAARGGKVKKALALLKNCEDGVWTDKEVEKYQQKCVEKLLQHCIQTVSAYKNQTSLCLQDWPVVNKASIKCSYEAYMSSAFDKGSLIKMSTSGSTGTPFVCWQDVDKKRHVNAEVLYYNGKTGYQIGRRIIYLRSVVHEISKSAFSQFSENIYLLNCTDLSDKGIEEKLEFIKEYTKGCGAMMMGYSSTLDAFRKYFDKYGYEKAQGCNLYGIVGGSTMLFDNTRESMENAFGCKCYSRYANEENGFLGQDGIENNVFLINRANYYIEILKMDSDVATEDGEIGRIVVTDLYNYAMPMVRYDTGDIGAWTEIIEGNRKRRAIGSFGGRVMDQIYHCNGIPVSPHSVSTAMWKFQNVEQYQFAQIGDGKYEIRLILEIKNLHLDETDLIESLKYIVGEEANICVKYPDTIPVPLSGKKRYIVNEMLNY